MEGEEISEGRHIARKVIGKEQWDFYKTLEGIHVRIIGGMIRRKLAKSIKY